jgi:hypothetical protein
VSNSYRVDKHYRKERANVAKLLLKIFLHDSSRSFHIPTRSLSEDFVRARGFRKCKLFRNIFLRGEKGFFPPLTKRSAHDIRVGGDSDKGKKNLLQGCESTFSVVSSELELL